jgi:hypothetical protein
VLRPALPGPGISRPMRGRIEQARPLQEKPATYLTGSTPAPFYLPMSRPTHPVFRAFAWVGVLCVLMLTVLAASPKLHAGLHDHEEESAHGAVPAGHPEHQCAVTLWANGATALLVFCLLMLVRPLAAGVIRRAIDELVPSLPRYRLVPSHAPPAA